MKRCNVISPKVYFLFLLIISYTSLLAQDTITSSYNWIELDDGLSFCETDAPEKSTLNDSKLTIVRIDPLKFEFNLFTATEYGDSLRSADNWANKFGLEIVFNAGMYGTKKGNPNKGYLINYDHFNNPTINGYYNAMMVLNPKDSTQKQFEIVDITCYPWDSIKDEYHSYCQGMRMIDCDGNPMSFDKNPTQSCSMIVLSTDKNGTIYIVFTRSPYTHQKMIQFLKSFPFDLRQTVYLEGGPEASLYIKAENVTISKYGSYVSKTWAKDDNDHFWEIPNVIGVRKK